METKHKREAKRRRKNFCSLPELQNGPFSSSLSPAIAVVNWTFERERESPLPKRRKILSESFRRQKRRRKRENLSSPSTPGNLQLVENVEREQRESERKRESHHERKTQEKQDDDDDDDEKTRTISISPVLI